MSEAFQKQSRFLSFILRHRPEAAGLKLDKDGWAVVAEIIANTDITVNILYEIVRTDSKGRYSLNEGLTKIRANQGHSTNMVDLKFQQGVPPPVLFHGTGSHAVADILKQGLVPMTRHYVHLSKDLETAIGVGSRRKHGFTILKIDAAKMLADGLKFFVSDNGVWLATAVPAKYIST